MYLGPGDGKGHIFEAGGYPLGSELQWHLSTPGKPSDGEALAPHGVHQFLMPPLSGQDTKTIMASFSFSQEWFDKTKEMWPLYNATNTDLRKLAKLGDKIILWQGAEDTTVQPATSLSLFEGIQKEMGVKETDNFLRYFLLPGVGHCGGGDSANQIDVLSPLMAWVETHKAPEVIVAGKPVPQTGGPGGGNQIGGGQAGLPQGVQAQGPPGGQVGPGAPNAAGGPGGPGPGFGGPGGGNPWAQAPRATVYTRPIYPYPNVAKYKGTGDPNDAANYQEVKGPAKVPQGFTNESSKLLGPDNQKFYHVENGQLVEDKAK
jgi:feruloyl esterase